MLRVQQERRALQVLQGQPEQPDHKVLLAQQVRPVLLVQLQLLLDLQVLRVRQVLLERQVLHRQ